MSDVRFWVNRYLQDGFGRPHPIPHGEKGPRIKGWQNPETKFAVGDWAEGDNVGAALIDDLVDVDLDCAEALACARDFLPPTECIHGNERKPDSHFWYRVVGAELHQFKDVPRPDPENPGNSKTDMLCELRAGPRFQTVLPPSTHPKGYPIEWSVYRQPGRPEYKELWRALTFVATVALLSRSWPKGNRHFAALHLAGFLCARKIDDEIIVKIVRWSATLAHDDEVEDRVTAARTTISEFKGGAKTSGGPALAELVGGEVLERLHEWYGGNSSIHDHLIEEMNRDRFMTRLGKDTVYGLELADEVVFQAARALFEEFVHDKIVVGEKKRGESKGEKITKSKFEIWREHTDKRRYRRVVFAPPPADCDPRDYNLWKGFSTAPLLPPEGDPARSSRESLREWADQTCLPLIDKYLALIRDVICSGVEEHYEYLIKWMAFTCQFPGTPAEVAVALKGEMGTGKGTFAREFGGLFARHYIHLDRTEQMAGKFNAAISGKVLVFADEAFFAGDKKDLGSLKRLITEPTLAIERKGFDVVQERNCVHLIMATNNEHAHQAAMRERRFFTVHVSDSHLQDHAYFNPVVEQIRKNQGALLSYLLTRIVTHDDIRRVPMTDELRVQQEKSLPYVLQWWKETLYHGTVADQPWPESVSTKALYDDYLRWCSARNYRHLDCSSDIELGRVTLKEYLGKNCRPRDDQGTRLSHRILEPLARCREIFDQKAGTKTPWDDGTEQAPEAPGPKTPKEPLPF